MNDPTPTTGRTLRFACGLFAVLGLALTSGCGGEAGDAGEDASQQEWAGGPQGHNNITPEVVRLELLAGVGSGKLCINTNDPNGCEITGAWDTWQNATYPVEKGQMLKAMVRCAMPQGYSVYVPGNGGGTFGGTFGYLPAWKTSALTTAQQEILSGCVLALINANNVDVTIGIVGSFSPGLPEGSPMPYFEACYYGNLFWPGPAGIACGGVQEDGGDRVPGRNKRICGNAGNPCRIDAVGSCNGSYVPSQSGYCRTWAGSGDALYCADARDDGSKHWYYASCVYLATQPPLVTGPLYRCGASGQESCQPEL